MPASLTACDAHLLHGALDVGSCPVVGMSFGPHASLFVAHLAPSSSGGGGGSRPSPTPPVPDAHKCGVSAWRDALVRTHLPFHVVVENDDDASSSESRNNNNNDDDDDGGGGGGGFPFPWPWPWPWDKRTDSSALRRVRLFPLIAP